MKVAVLGASGLVGREMLKVMAERNFPIDELKLLSGPGSAGKPCVYQGKEYIYEEASENSFEGITTKELYSSSFAFKLSKYNSSDIKLNSIVFLYSILNNSIYLF